MRPITSKSFIKAFSKEFNMQFCEIFSYYEGNPYVDNNNELLKDYFLFKGYILKLQYFSGCFNPYLVIQNIKDFGFITKEGTVKIEQIVFCPSESIVKKYQNHYKHLFSKF